MVDSKAVPGRACVRWIGEEQTMGYVGIPTIGEVVVTSLGRVFGPVVALRSVSARFASEGRLNLVLGSNGSGKTTLLWIIGTLLKPSFGHVVYGESHPVEVIRRGLGWVSHEALCYPDLTGREAVGLAARTHGLDASSAVESSCSRFGLGRFATRPLGSNSRGQRQRIALARALVHCPSLILLDEPSTGLDTDGVRTLVRVVQEEVEKGSVVILVTHEPDAFDEIPSRRLVLDRGSVVSSST